MPEKKSKKEKLSSLEVEHIADLARIELSKEEKVKYAEDLSAVLSYIDQLNEVDAADVQITGSATGLVNAVREDIAEECGAAIKEKIIASAPLTEDGYIKVKAIL